MPLDIKLVRDQFPALDQPVIFLDNPGGTQIAQQSIERINRYLVETNANYGAAFTSSRLSDKVEFARVDGESARLAVGRSHDRSTKSALIITRSVSEGSLRGSFWISLAYASGYDSTFLSNPH